MFEFQQAWIFSNPLFATVMITWIFSNPLFATVMITSAFISLSLCSNTFSLFQCYVTSELFVWAVCSFPPASFPWHCQEDINLTENKKPSYCLSFTRIYMLISFKSFCLLPVTKTTSDSWCCGNHCWLAIVLWCGYCLESFQTFVLCQSVIAPICNNKKLPKTTKEGLELKK